MEVIEQKSYPAPKGKTVVTKEVYSKKEPQKLYCWNYGIEYSFCLSNRYGNEQ